MKTGQKLQKSGKKTKIKYNQIKASPEAINKHLDKAFDTLFKEVNFKKYDHPDH
jgi:hypothetical protein